VIGYPEQAGRRGGAVARCLPAGAAVLEMRTTCSSVLLRLAIVCGLFGLPAGTALAPPPPPPNVLLVAVDDLRPEIGCFHPWSEEDTILTPHLDGLARRGTLFSNAVVQFALCAPSRTSFLTSLRPDTTRVWTIGPHFRNTTARGRTAVTLPQAFKDAGFHTESFGKIFHINDACYRRPLITGSSPRGCLDDPDSWSEASWRPDPYEERGVNHTKTGALGTMNRADQSWLAVDAADEAFPDGNISAHAVAALHRISADRIANRSRYSSFFVGAGFLKPHLPQVFPKRYLDMYAGLPAPTPVSGRFHMVCGRFDWDLPTCCVFWS
jgi:iduronate 2-sulfatase